LTFPERFMTVSEMAENALATFVWTVSNGEQSGKFDPERSHALVEKVHAHGSKRKELL